MKLSMLSGLFQFHKDSFEMQLFGQNYFFSTFSMNRNLCSQVTAGVLISLRTGIFAPFWSLLSVLPVSNPPEQVN